MSLREDLQALIAILGPVESQGHKVGDAISRIFRGSSQDFGNQASMAAHSGAAAIEFGLHKAQEAVRSIEQFISAAQSHVYHLPGGP